MHDEAALKEKNFGRGVLCGPSYDIETPSYVSKIRYLGKSFIQMSRLQSFSGERRLVDTLGPTWLLAQGRFASGQVGIRSGNQFFYLENNMTIFVPPFSLIEWHLQRGQIEWWGVASDEPVPAEFSKNPVVFKNSQALPGQINHVWQLLREFLPFAKRVIEEVQPSSLSQNVKQKIIENYKEILKVSDIAKFFEISRVVMTREFSKTYNISPIAYRQKLRIFDAVRLMNCHGNNLTEAALSAGFSSSSQFIHHFKKHLGTLPKNYKVPKMSSNPAREVSY